MRRLFADKLFKHAKKNKDIIVVTMDLGYKLWNQFRDELPEQFINVGASEQAGMGIACGLALEGKIPFIYSITTFLLYRPFETIRNYVNHEKLNVKLIASGRDKDYTHDGFSHWSEDAKYTLKLFPNIQCVWPEKKEDIPDIVDEIIKHNKPYFLSLRR